MAHEFTTTEEKPTRRGRPGPHPLLALLALFAVLTLPLVVIEAGRAPITTENREGATFPTSEAFDQDLYHLPVIERFAAQLPTPELSRYPSATTPGYHLAQSVVFRAFGGAKLPMIALNMLVGATLIGGVWLALSRLTDPWTAALLALPLMCSQYLLGSSVWLTTDNAGWLFALGAMGIGILGAGSARAAALGGVLATLAVLVRQVHLWSAAPVAFAGLLASPLRRFVPGAARGGDPAEIRWSSLAIGAAALSAPAVVLAAFALAWGGLLPPDQDIARRHAQGFTATGAVFSIAMMAVAGSPYLLALRGGVAGAARAGWPVAIAIGAGALALVPPTGFSPPLRAYGWLWVAASDLPDRLAGATIADRAPAMVLLAAIGAFALAALWRAAPSHRRPLASITILTWLGFTIAQSANSAVWQRYYEPMAIFTAAVLAALALPKPPTRPRSAFVAAFAAFQLLVTAVFLHIGVARWLLAR